MPDAKEPAKSKLDKYKQVAEDIFAACSEAEEKCESILRRARQE